MVLKHILKSVLVPRGDVRDASGKKSHTSFHCSDYVLCIELSSKISLEQKVPLLKKAWKQLHYDMMELCHLEESGIKQQTQV